MGRPITYDPDTALDRAVDLFWRRGYQAVSVDELVRSTGLNRHSLYGRYGNKSGLFDAAIARYDVEVTHRLRAIADAPGTGRERIEQIMALRDPDCPDPFWRNCLERGCFASRALGEFRDSRPDVVQRCGKAISAVQRVIASIIASGQADGTIRADRSAEELAAVVFSGFFAASVLPPDPQRNRAILSILT